MPVDQTYPEPTAGPTTSPAVEALKDVPHEPGAPKPDPILVASNIQRHFGGLVAVDVEHVEVQRGAITALIGPNGAGKTTFFNLLTGFDQPQQGKWTFNGKSLKGVPSFRVARMGMVRTFQLTKSLAKLSVIENMRLGAVDQRGENFWRGLIPGLWRGQEAKITEKASELLERFNLAAKQDDFAGTMSGGQRKLLEMARALMMDPEMVMLDEPMAGVNPALTQSLLGHIKDLRKEGMTVLFVEHDMDMVRDISDWVIVMGQGAVIAEGPPHAVMANPAVIEAYLGGHHDESLFEDRPDVVHEAVATGELSEPGATATPAAAELASDAPPIEASTPAGTEPDATEEDR
jgi:branched-chain amino acid transport system ATP-binding protein